MTNRSTTTQGAEAIGASLYEQVKAMSLRLYQFGHDRARAGGDDPGGTPKFEFGTDATGQLFFDRRGC